MNTHTLLLRFHELHLFFMKAMEDEVESESAS